MTLEENNNKNICITVDHLKKKYISPEDTNKMHYHQYHEFLILVNGFITYTTNNGIIKISEKSIVYMPAHTLHNPFVQDCSPYERYIIRFYPNFSDGIITQPHLLNESLKTSYIKQLNKNDFNEIYSITESLYKITNSNNDDELHKLNECMHLAMLITKGSNAIAIPHTPQTSYITDIIDYIKENYSKPLTIQLLADNFFVSKSKLIYDFNNYCRISILEFITMTRIESAKEYLLKGWSVTAASNACGFSTPSYFIKVFSKITGLTPLKFQARHANY